MEVTLGKIEVILGTGEGGNKEGDGSNTVEARKMASEWVLSVFRDRSKFLMFTLFKGSQ